MRTTVSLLLLASAGALGASGAYAAPAVRTAHATILDASGGSVAIAVLTPVADGLRLVVDAMHLPPGTHGIHVHTTGLCDAPDFKTAGGHWNPTGKMHGMHSPQGMHMGDLPNIDIGADGTGHLDTVIKGGMLSGGAYPLLDADGAAVVVHATADDYRTDPAGNSGARIACGVIGAD